MGYSTSFSGRIELDPPLSEAEADYLNAFRATRHMERPQGPYFIQSAESQGGFGGPEVPDPNSHPEDQPGLYCHWQPTADLAGIEWDGSMKGSRAPAWMAYLRTHFITLGAAAQVDPAMHFFTRHAMSGTILAVGEEALDDVFRIEVDEQGVWTRHGSWSALARAQIFDQDGYADRDTALAYLVSHPDAVEWDAQRVRKPDFPTEAANVRFESASLQRASLPAFKARSVARSL